MPCDESNKPFSLCKRLVCAENEGICLDASCPSTAYRLPLAKTRRNPEATHPRARPRSSGESLAALALPSSPCDIALARGPPNLMPQGLDGRGALVTPPPLLPELPICLAADSPRS